MALGAHICPAITSSPHLALLNRGHTSIYMNRAESMGLFNTVKNKSCHPMVIKSLAEKNNAIIIFFCVYDFLALKSRAEIKKTLSAYSLEQH